VNPGQNASVEMGPEEQGRLAGTANGPNWGLMSGICAGLAGLPDSGGGAGYPAKCPARPRVAGPARFEK